MYPFAFATAVCFLAVPWWQTMQNRQSLFCATGVAQSSLRSRLPSAIGKPPSGVQGHHAPGGVVWRGSARLLAAPWWQTMQNRLCLFCATGVAQSSLRSRLPSAIRKPQSGVQGHHAPGGVVWRGSAPPEKQHPHNTSTSQRSDGRRQPDRPPGRRGGAFPASGL